MKLQTTKKLFAFLIIIMFSISFLNAQCPACKGNQVAMKIYDRALRTRCVKPKDVDTYLSAGWQICGLYSAIRKMTNKKMPNTPLVKIPSDNAIVSNKIFRR